MFLMFTGLAPKAKVEHKLENKKYIAEILKNFVLKHKL